MAAFDLRFRLTNEAGGRGLSCDSDGVLLAGVPLLQKSPHGLSARPMDELKTLIDCAYVFGIEPAGLFAGLRVVADALNRGDLGKAMIAAVHLRLPELDQTGVLRIAAAEEILSKRALCKYDPAEPRDARGRWTTGNGSAGREPDNATHPATSGSYPRHRSPITAGGRMPDASSSTTQPSTPALTPARNAGAHLYGGALTLASDPEAANDNFPPLTARLMSMLVTRQCIQHARDPDYQSKVEECRDVGEKCLALATLSERNPKINDTCVWPDGTVTGVRFGQIFPFIPGHHF